MTNGHDDDSPTELQLEEAVGSGHNMGEINRIQDDRVAAALESIGLLVNVLLIPDHEASN